MLLHGAVKFGHECRHLGNPDRTVDSIFRTDLPLVSIAPLAPRYTVQINLNCFQDFWNHLSILRLVDTAGYRTLLQDGDEGGGHQLLFLLVLNLSRLIFD